MANAVDRFMKCMRSGADPTKILDEIQNLLSTNNFPGISCANLEKLVFGPEGLIRFCESSTQKSEYAAEFILMLVRFGILSIKLLNLKRKDHLVSVVLSVTKNSRKEELWISCLSLLTNENLAETIGSSKILSDMTCDFFLQIHTVATKSSQVLEQASAAFYRLWESQVDLFLRQPTLSALHSVVQTLAFGMALAKLVPEKYIQKLSRLSGKLIDVERKLQSSGLVPKAHFFSMREVVDLSPMKMLSMIADILLQKPGPVLVILKQLVSMFPAFIMDEPSLVKIIEILMCAIRMPSQDIGNMNNETKDPEEISEEPAVLSLDIFIKLVTTLSSYGSKFNDLPRLLLQLFDLLRAFPTTLAHSEARLFAWWHFICCLNSDLLTDGFRKFLSPFLANLLGRYLSISTPQGDPQLHPYKLSQGNVYEGNAKAFELVQHVYSCFFSESSVKFHQLNVPRLSVNNQLLTQNSYPLLVGLLYWIRSVCKYRFSWSPEKLKIPSHCLPSQSVDVIWCGCVNYLLRISKSIQEPLTYKKVTPFQSPSLSVRASSSSSAILSVWQHIVTVTCELIQPHDLITSSGLDTIQYCPSPSESLNIIQNFIQLLEEFKLPDKEKIDLISSLCVKSVELGGFWLKENSTRKTFCVSQDDFHRWGTQIIRLIDMEPRLNLSNKSITMHILRLTGEQHFLNLIRLILIGLLSDFVEFISSNISSQSSFNDDSTQLSLSNCPPVRFSPDALRVWSVLVDRITQFILDEHRVSENQSAIDIDLSTVESALLMPFWLAGASHPNTINGNHDSSSDAFQYLSFKDSLAISVRQSNLFSAFHQECCLLTTVPTNAWINQLSVKLSTLILSYAPKVMENINLHLISRFVHCLAQSAEIYEEKGNQKDTHCTFASVKIDDQPLGQLTGLVSLLNSLLLYIPWLHPPTQTENDDSPPCYLSAQESTTQWLTSPPVISIRTRTNQLNNEKSANNVHSINRSANSNQVSYGLLDALETVVFLLNNHLHETDSVLSMFSKLESSLTRLVDCCVKAEKAVIEAGTDLDEPLLITQHRQHAKLALEEVFICIWKQMKVVPPNVSINNPLSMFRTIPDKQDLKTPATTPVFNSEISDSIHPIAQYEAIFSLSLTLCGYNVKSNQESCECALQLSVTFMNWFIGFWNYLVDQYCVKQTKSNSSKLLNFRNFLINLEPEFQKIIIRTLNPNIQQLTDLSPSEKSTSRRKSISRKTPKSEPTKRLSRLSKRLSSSSSSQSPVISNNLKLKIEENSPIDSLVTTSRSDKKLSFAKDKFKPEKSRKPNTIVGDLFSDILVSQNNNDPKKPSHNPSIRSRRGRLSLVKVNSPIEKMVTPVRRSFEQTENITQSAPSNSSSRRGRGRKGVNLFPASPKPSPTNGIIAEAFGIPPGTSLIDNENDNHNWSPTVTSPGPLPCRPLVKRRLFGGPQEVPVTESKSNNSNQLSLQPTRKRHFSDSEQNTTTSKVVTISTCCEDTCDFIFIPPQSESVKKRRRYLTTHQKERFKEQLREYIPTMYNELDISQQSWSSISGGGGGSESQSQIEFSPQSSVNKDCQEVSETLEPLDSHTKPNVTEELNNESSQTENITVKNSTSPLCMESECIPTKAVLSPSIDPLTEKESDLKDDFEIIQDTETINTECELDCVDEISSRLNTSDLSGQTNSNQFNESFNLPSTTLPKQSPKDENDKVSPPTITVSIPPILTSRPNNHTLSSPLIRGSSRAQKMLVLGLQKAAEQTARQRSSSGDHNSGSLSLDNSPTLTERKSTLNLLASSSRSTLNPSVADSPSGIIRNLWSKKKSQRVSFVEQPVVYTIEPTNSIEQESDEDYDHDNQIDFSTNRERIVFSNDDDGDKYEGFNDLNGNEPDEVVINGNVEELKESNKKNEEMEINGIPMSKIQADVTSKQIPVDLDASQDSSQSVFSITTEIDKETAPSTLSENSFEPSLHHRRKSASPQRRELPIKKVSSGYKYQSSNQLLKSSKGRPLFMEPVHQTEVISYDSKTSESTESLHMNKKENILVIDSESTLIADTQLEESTLQTNDIGDNSSRSNKQTQEDEFVTTDGYVDDECILIEGSQGSSQINNTEDQLISSMNSQINQYNFSPINVEESSEMNNDNNSDTKDNSSSSQTIAILTDNNDTNDKNVVTSSLIGPNETIDERDVTSSTLPDNNNEIMNENSKESEVKDDTVGDNKENQPGSTMMSDSTENDVEKDILDKLSQIATSLPILRPEQRRAVLLEALSTFKSIMP
ncbi:hypothetical protein MS3_00000935 [Schistosoma haematobium]|uniref:Uncharacterized protein n=1 Tax=Schistosoma haematobium TaxID=6185 RepID=A0A922LZC3_SCHHA|nr:hypothetical protein MS3_00000935 [Schistosoma haematobium]KAH9596586.1 hypothetical protein MS3_00000935 [Schistosoma haematobium]